MTGNRGTWSVGLVLGLGLGLSLAGCAGNHQGLVETSPASAGVGSRLLAWRTRVGLGVAAPARTADPAVAAASHGTADAAKPKQTSGASRLAKYWPGWKRRGGAEDSKPSDFVQPAGRDLWADAARKGAEARLDRWRDGARQAPQGREEDDASVLPVAMEVGTDHTTIRPRPTPARARPRVSAVVPVPAKQSRTLSPGRTPATRRR